jgi:hypothetical protein
LHSPELSHASLFSINDRLNGLFGTGGLYRKANTLAQRKYANDVGSEHLFSGSHRLAFLFRRSSTVVTFECAADAAHPR